MSVVRVWRGRTTAEEEPGFTEMIRNKVIPHLEGHPRYRGTMFLGRDAGEGREILMMTFWASREAADEVGGPELDQAMVPEELRLESEEEDAGNYEVLLAHELERLGS